jgi:hypothetical protein
MNPPIPPLEVLLTRPPSLLYSSSSSVTCFAPFKIRFFIGLLQANIPKAGDKRCPYRAVFFWGYVNSGVSMSGVEKDYWIRCFGGIDQPQK